MQISNKKKVSSWNSEDFALQLSSSMQFMSFLDIRSPKSLYFRSRSQEDSQSLSALDDCNLSFEGSRGKIQEVFEKNAKTNKKTSDSRLQKLEKIKQFARVDRKKSGASKKQANSLNDSKDRKNSKTKNSDNKLEKGKVEKTKLLTPVLGMKKNLKDPPKENKAKLTEISKKLETLEKNTRLMLSDKQLASNSGKILKTRVDLPLSSNAPEAEKPILSINSAEIAKSSEKKVKILPAMIMFNDSPKEPLEKPSLPSTVPTPLHDEYFIDSDMLYQELTELNEFEDSQLEGSQKFVICSEASSRNSIHSDCQSIPAEKHLAPFIPNQITPRELSFGLGGGEFNFMESQRKLQDCDKNTQTDFKLNNLEELLSMISDKEFLNGLKIIGKFANLLENSCFNSQ